MIWKNIDDFYAVSEKGDILNLKTKNIIKPHDNGYGYLAVKLHGKNYKIHRIVAREFIGASDMLVRHINGNKIDNHFTNLKYGTDKENYEDSIRHGTNSKGKINGKTKLSEDSVFRIKKMISLNVELDEICKLEGVSKRNLYKIKYNQTWKHIKA